MQTKNLKTGETQPNVKPTFNGIQANGTWKRRENIFVHPRLLEISESLLSTTIFFKRNYLKYSPFAIITVNDTYHNDEVNTDIPESDYFLSKKTPLFKFQIIKSPSNEKQSFLYENVEKSHFSNFFQNSFKSQCSSKPAFPRELGRFHWSSNHVINKSPWAAPKFFIKITYFFFICRSGGELSKQNEVRCMVAYSG